jgi:hypothetical protein
MVKKYVSYITVNLNSEGATPTEVTDKLKGMGWEVTYGPYDYKYSWTETENENYDNIYDFLTKLENIHNTLKGLNVYYKVVTYEEGKETWTYN